MSNEFDTRFDDIYNKDRIPGQRTVGYDKRGRMVQNIDSTNPTDLAKIETIEKGSRLDEINEMTDGGIDTLYVSLQYAKKKVDSMFKQVNRKYRTEQIINTIKYALTPDDETPNYGGVDLVELFSKLYSIDKKQAQSYVKNMGEWALSSEGIEELVDRISESLGEIYIVENTGMIDEGMIKTAFIARAIAKENVPIEDQETEEM